MDGYGIFTLLPVVVVIVTAIISKRTVEPLLLGVVVGYAMTAKLGFFPAAVAGMQQTISDNAYYIILFGLFGMVTVLLEQSGSALGFGELGSKVAKSRGVSILITWIFGILVFIDDYLNNLGVGTAMRDICDKNKVPRELLAYTLNSTGAAVCVLVPMSSWAVLMMGIYDELAADGYDILVNGDSFTTYLHTIPFIFYAIVAVLIVPLIGFGIIPTWGPMRKAMKRADEGQVYSEYYMEHQKDAHGYDIKASSPWYFIVPMAGLIAVSLILNDILTGMFVGLGLCFVMYIPTKLMKLSTFFDNCWKGFETMVLVTAIVITAFCLQGVNAELGLTEYIIAVTEPVLTPALLPCLAFIICAFIAMCTGSFWGTMTIASPIMIPLAIAVGSNPLLVGGAIVSAGAFGSHACFYGDAATLASAVSGMSNDEYMKTALPMIIAPTVAAVILFLVFGIVMC